MSVGEKRSLSSRWGYCHILVGRSWSTPLPTAFGTDEGAYPESSIRYVLTSKVFQVFTLSVSGDRANVTSWYWENNGWWGECGWVGGCAEPMVGENVVVWVVVLNRWWGENVVV